MKRFKIKQLFATVAIAFVLFLTTACTSGNQMSANPQTDDRVADLDVKSNASDLNYPGADLSNSSNPDVGAMQQKSLPPLPNAKQPMIDRADPSSKVLERAGQSIQDASAFLKDTANAANERPEAKANPAIEK
ncbi:hypothetical protein IQ250_25085 [Pseudanabaenaceae cyanobacterium LEGE 13415]|nr:hypothetical protein [Pseudanabaenaceae cyanobacterium LEGE 13415]